MHASRVQGMVNHNLQHFLYDDVKIVQRRATLFTCVHMLQNVHTRVQYCIIATHLSPI